MPTSLKEIIHSIQGNVHSLQVGVNFLKESVLHGNLHLGGFDKSINDIIIQIFPGTVPPRITHSFFVSPKDFSKHVNRYPNELPGIGNEGVKKAYYDLGAETLNYWLLNKACDLVLDNLPPGASHGLKGLSAIYHLDLNPGYKRLEEIGGNITPEIIQKALFEHKPGIFTDKFIYSVGKLACPVSPHLGDKEKLSKIRSKIQGLQLTQNWIGDFEAVAQSPKEMSKPEWLNFVTLAELFGFSAILLSQPVPGSILLGSSICNIGLSVLDGIHKNIYMRSLSETDFGIRKISWNKETK